MTKELNYKVFLVANLNKFIIVIVNSKGEKIFKNEKIINDQNNSNYFNNLDQFINENIFKIEKLFKQFINDIFLIIDNKDFLYAKLSIKNKSIIDTLNTEIVNDLLFTANNQFKKTLTDSQIIHYQINKFVIDEQEYFSLPKKKDYSSLFIEVEFVCIKKILINKFKTILSKYQIYVNKVYCYEYLLRTNINKKNSNLDIVNNALSGLGINEVLIENHSYKKKRGIFEVFFNFFN